MTTTHADLIARLRALSRYEHDDATIGDEAADALEAMQAAPLADDALPEWIRNWFEERYQAGDVFIDGPETLTLEAATDLVRAAIARERESMNELRRAVAELVGEDQETWPDHGNAPLAIGATVAILHAGCERAEAEISTLRQQLAERSSEAERWAAECNHAENNIDNLREQLDHERREHQAAVHTCHDDCKMAGCVNVRLRQQLAEAERDADRYRWLRDHDLSELY